MTTMHGMQNWQPANPVERRLMQAHTDWMGFAQDAHARLMVWRTDAADAQLVRLYFQAQQEMSSAVIGLRSDFADGAGYARALAAELIRFYGDRREASIAQGLRADWQAPPDAGRDATLYFLTTIDSLVRHHPDLFPGMVLLLEPGQVKDTTAMAGWLGTLVSMHGTLPWLSTRLRFVVPQEDGGPLALLPLQRSGAVRVVRGRYAMPRVPRELVADSGERGPGGQLRHLFVQLSETVGHADGAQLEPLRMAALRIAEQEQWLDQSVIVHLIAGAAYLKRHGHGQAIAAYRQAAVSARQAVEAGHPAGHKLVVNSLFGEASVHLMRKDHAMAAYCYESAAASAALAQDAVLGVEAWRMSAVCWERAGEREHALEAGFNALDAGHAIDASQRVRSNLRLVVEWLAGQIGASDRRRAALSDKVSALLSER